MGFSDDVRRLEQELQRTRQAPPRLDTEALDEEERAGGSGADAEPVGDRRGLGARADVELGEDA
ncbi:hypothetical protein [Capillimicrobium parvum]|uniref:Uncharacterized protein n=1 Tax=Capillimicrobium parvum TaxID=2884022 RepID=A0A9E6XUI7_9ACTN|nr:hypothetical protein [Capillimicrobium parvum]UGS34027.1 hypothetical protein DSM104329_00397 [Capillimicrobium parvum]